MAEKIIARDCAHLQQIIRKTIEKEGLNCDLNFIDVSKVFRLEALFKDSSFNGDISKWDVSNVTNMKDMFCGSQFNGDIGKWNVSNVKNMSGMFKKSVFDGDISKWNVSKVTNMKEMFRESHFDGNIAQWNVSNVHYMQKMFYESQFCGDIGKWNVSNVKNMEGIFFNAPHSNRDVSKWEISEDCRTEGMFSLEYSDFVKSYLKYDYFMNLKNVFEKEFQPYNYPGSHPSNRSGSFKFGRGKHRSVQSLLNRSRNTSSDGFFFSCIFLFHLMTNNALRSECNKGSFAYNKLVEFWEKTCWLDLGIEVFQSYGQKEFLCNDLRDIIRYFGLVNKKGNVYNFIRACIFDRLYEVLRDDLRMTNMPQSAEKNVLKTVKSRSQKILNTLSKFPEI